MKILDVYHKWPVEPVRGRGSHVWDKNGKSYLDLYGGHGVISVGHNHPLWKERLAEQLERISFYSNAVPIPLQEELAEKLGEVSSCKDYSLFLCNSGAEANENAIKIASFHTGKSAVVAFRHSFHGRTAGALSVTDNAGLSAPFNQGLASSILPLNDIEALEERLRREDVAAVIVEGIQGVAGIIMPEDEFLAEARRLCDHYGALLILDEVQSGYGRSGKFFAHQYAGIQPDIITTAKGMGNGFPVAGVLVRDNISVSKGELGTTFGGSYLACAAALAVVEIIAKQDLMKNVREAEVFIREKLSDLPGLKRIRGRGLMLGLEFVSPVKDLQMHLLSEGVFTGSSADPCVLRILPPLNISLSDIRLFCELLRYSNK